MINKKVLIVASVASMIDQFNKINIDVMQNLGYEVHVACNFSQGGNITNERTETLIKELENNNIKYFQVDFERNPLQIHKLIKPYIQLRKIMENKYDILHTHSPVGGAIGRIVSKKYRRKGLISIYTAHGFHFYKGSSKLSWVIFFPLEKYLSRFTDILITINEEDFNLVKEKKFHSEKNIYIPGVGIDLEKFKPTYDSKEKQNLLEKKMPKVLNLMYVGELNTNKNQMFLIEVIKLLKPNINNIKLYLVGSGNNAYISKIKQKLKIYKLEDNVQLLGFRNDIKDLLETTDIYVSSSKREGLPVNIMEAMAMGIPIVASDNRGHRSLVVNGITGYLVPLNNTKKFTNKIMKLSTDLDLYYNFSSSSRKEIEKFSTKNIERELEIVYGIKE